MLILGEKVYLKNGLAEKNFPQILAGFKDLSMIGLVAFAHEVSQFETVKELKAFFSAKMAMSNILKFMPKIPMSLSGLLILKNSMKIEKSTNLTSLF